MTGFAEAALAAARVATGVLGWTPDMFWSATVAELMTAVEGRYCLEVPPLARPLESDHLKRLKERFPDG